MQSYPEAHNLPGIANQNGCLPYPTMRFSNRTTFSLSSLSQRIDHGNIPAAGSIAMSASTSCTDNNMSTTVSANLAGPVNTLNASYLHAFQQAENRRGP